MGTKMQLFLIFGNNYLYKLDFDAITPLQIFKILCEVGSASTVAPAAARRRLSEKKSKARSEASGIN